MSAQYDAEDRRATHEEAAEERALDGARHDQRAQEEDADEADQVLENDGNDLFILKINILLVKKHLIS